MLTRTELRAENDRLRKGLQKIHDEHGQRSVWEKQGKHPTEYSKAWSDGYITALAHCSLIASEHLDPVAWAEHEESWRGAACDSDREWFERTGCCGHCGERADYCRCKPDDPCACGPHKLAAEDLPCRYCRGTGVAIKGTGQHPLFDGEGRDRSRG